MNKPSKEEEKYIVTFEEFSKIHLKIGEILQAEIIPGYGKVDLLKVKVDIGMEQRDLSSALDFFTDQKN